MAARSGSRHTADFLSLRLQPQYPLGKPLELAWKRCHVTWTPREVSSPLWLPVIRMIQKIKKFSCPAGRRGMMEANGLLWQITTECAFMRHYMKDN